MRTHREKDRQTHTAYREKEIEREKERKKERKKERERERKRERERERKSERMCVCEREKRERKVPQ